MDALPPDLPLRFLRWFCDPQLLEDVEGDLVELYHTRQKAGDYRAKWLFTLDVLKLLRPGIIRNFELDLHQINYSMLINHFKTAIRQARKHKGYTLINVSGLVVGLVSCILILLWVADEIQMDKFHAKADRLYQVWRNMHQAQGISTTPGIPQPLENVLRDEYPEVEDVTAVSWEMEFLFRLNEETSYEKGRYASPGFFQVFSYPLLTGDPVTALDDLHSVVISERLAKKFFGDNWPALAIGSLLKIDERQEFSITGVFKDPGSNSSLKFDWIIPEAEYMSRNDWVDSWYNGGVRIFLTLKDQASLTAVQGRVREEINNHTNHEANELIYLQRFSDNYLHSTFENGIPVGGRIQYVRILLAIALFVLLVACINFMNLATARSSMRAREIGVRKVLGALRGSLKQQFFAESFMHATVSMIVALFIVRLALPYFNELTGKSLSLDMGNPQLWIGVVAITLLTGVLSGSYPALLLSSFAIISSLKGTTRRSSSTVNFRHGLATFQFAISIFLICGTIVVSRQMDYILNKDLGLVKENVIMIDMEGELFQRNDVYRDGLQKIHGVKDVTFTSGNPLSYGSSTGGASWEGKNPDDVVEINVLSVDANFITTMGMDIVEGQNFTNVFTTDSSHFIINEVLRDIMGYDNPVGKKLSVWGTDGTIAGVVRDFHMDSMYEPIVPLIVRYRPLSTSLALVRTQGKTQDVIQAVEKVTRALNPSFPFRYHFLDQEYSNSYENETAVSTLVNIFAVVSIFISCLGLLGLSSFAADQRSREIGIRKVHGAPTASLVFLLSNNYTRLMIIAFVVATPVSYLYMQHWLNGFAFRADLSFSLFFVAGIAAFILGALTVTFKAYQAASANPSKTLKEE
jgi:predicted permease